MTDSLTLAARSIFDTRALAHVASLDSEGAPHVTPVWVTLDGDLVVINTALGRAKAKNLANDARVAVSLTDPADDQRVVALRGTVVDFTTEGADELIDALAKKYLDVDTYPFRREGEVRVTVRIRPDRISMQPS